MWVFISTLIFTLLFTDFKDVITSVCNSAYSCVKLLKLLSPSLNLVRHIDSKMIRDYIIFKLRLTMTKYLESGLLSSSTSHYELIYFSGTQKYRILFPKKRGPKSVTKVVTHCDIITKDVTCHILECMGPSHNFHGISTTPFLLGYKNLTFILRNGTELIFTDKELIKIF